MTSSRYIIYTSMIIGLFCALLCLLSSCEKELTGEGSGRKMAVTISLNSSGYADDTRSTIAHTPKSETTVIPLGDGLYISATLTEAPVDKLRAAINLVEGQKVRLAAFKGTTSTQESTADYLYSGGKLTPVSSSLMVEENANYNIVAYSYYNETSVYPPTTNTNSDKQLLWGASGQKYITATDATVSITMVQKFAQAKVSISSANLAGTPNITAVSGVTITSGGNRRNLSVWNGTLSAGSTHAQAVTFSTFGSSTATSDPRTIYPVAAGQTTTVTIGNISVGGSATSSTNKATFNQAFLEGHSYILTLDLKEINFAGSNIYWDGSKMTFKPTGYVGLENLYQGLHFKWGSMMGIGMASYAFSSTRTQFYYPTDDNTWATAPSSLYATVADIPNMDLALAASHGTGPATDYVTNGYALDNGGQPFNYTDKLGDICRRINPNYRLPRAEEFGINGIVAWDATESNAPGWAKGTDAAGNDLPWPATAHATLLNKITAADGTTVLDAAFGAAFVTYRGIAKFPASSAVTSAGNRTPAIGSGGYYFSSSVSTSNPFRIVGRVGDIRIDSSTPVNYAHSVRCVKN